MLNAHGTYPLSGDGGWRDGDGNNAWRRAFRIGPGAAYELVLESPFRDDIYNGSKFGRDMRNALINKGFLVFSFEFTGSFRRPDLVWAVYNHDDNWYVIKAEIDKIESIEKLRGFKTPSRLLKLIEDWR